MFIRKLGCNTATLTDPSLPLTQTQKQLSANKFTFLHLVFTWLSWCSSIWFNGIEFYIVPVGEKVCTIFDEKKFTASKLPHMNIEHANSIRIFMYFCSQVNICIKYEEVEKLISNTEKTHISSPRTKTHTKNTVFKCKMVKTFFSSA